MRQRTDRLQGLKPEFLDKLGRVLQRMRARGFHPWVVCGLRTLAEQKELYKIGRRGIKGERCVTWTMKSRHITGRAADVIEANQMWNAPEAFWAALAFEAKKEGLDAGYFWRKKDKPHIELPFTNNSQAK